MGAFVATQHRAGIFVPLVGNPPVNAIGPGATDNIEEANGTALGCATRASDLDVNDVNGYSFLDPDRGWRD